MVISTQHAMRLDAEPATAAHFDVSRRSAARPAPMAAAAFAAAMPARSEGRIAVLTADSLLAFAVTALATSHFPAVTVARPEVEDIRAARHLDSRGHSLIIVDSELLGQIGAETVGAWLRPFRAVPMLLMSPTSAACRLEGCASVTDVPRDVTARGLAETIRRHLRCADRGGDRRQRPQEIDRLTATQWRVIGYLGGGHSNKEIAYRMGISEATVKAHVGAAIARLGLTNRTEVALFAQRLAFGSRWSAAAADAHAP